MTELIPINESTGLTRDVRRTSRGISRSRSYAQLRMAGISDETDVAMEKVEALTAATGSGMSAVTRVAQAQRQLETLAPEASGRLAFLAEAHVLAVGDSLQDLRRSLRRH